MKEVYLCGIEALREGTNDKYGVSATLVFNKGLTYKELKQVIDEKYFYLSNNNLQDRINKAIEYINRYLPNYDFDHSNLEKLLKILRGEDNES